MSRLSIALVVISALLVPRSVLADVEYDATIPQLKFAAQEIERAVIETGRKDLMVTLTVKSDSTSPEAFQIRSAEPNRVDVIGSDATGAMYGGIEVAEYLKLGLPIANVQRKPFVAKRGIKFNIPLDARALPTTTQVTLPMKTSNPCGILRDSGSPISMTWRVTATTF